MIKDFLNVPLDYRFLPIRHRFHTRHIYCEECGAAISLQYKMIPTGLLNENIYRFSSGPGLRGGGDKEEGAQRDSSFQRQLKGGWTDLEQQIK